MLVLTNLVGVVCPWPGRVILGAAGPKPLTEVRWVGLHEGSLATRDEPDVRYWALEGNPNPRAKQQTAVSRYWALEGNPNPRTKTQTATSVTQWPKQRLS